MLRPVVFVSLLGACSADADDDGLSRRDERELGTNDRKPDTDGDGLGDGAEVDLGSNPLKPDSDDDGLLDGEETELGTSPILVDSDGDGYSDFDEIEEDADPTDPDDRIYEGRWPYNPNRDAVDLSPWTGKPLEIGDRFGRFGNGKDQFRDEVDIRDFAARGRYVVVDASATWCVPCREVSAWLSRGPDDDALALEPSFGTIRAAVDAGDLTWITFVTENDAGSAEIPVSDVKAWDADFPHPKIPVVTDIRETIELAVNRNGAENRFPSLVVLDEDLVVVFRGESVDVLDFLRLLL